MNSNFYHFKVEVSVKFLKKNTFFKDTFLDGYICCGYSLEVPQPGVSN